MMFLKDANDGVVIASWRKWEREEGKEEEEKRRRKRKTKKKY